MPAQAGIQFCGMNSIAELSHRIWIPASAGMTLAK